MLSTESILGVILVLFVLYHASWANNFSSTNFSTLLLYTHAQDLAEVAWRTGVWDELGDGLQGDYASLGRARNEFMQYSEKTGVCLILFVDEKASFESNCNASFSSSVSIERVLVTKTGFSRVRIQVLQ